MSPALMGLEALTVRLPLRAMDVVLAPPVTPPLMVVAPPATTTSSFAAVIPAGQVHRPGAKRQVADGQQSAAHQIAEFGIGRVQGAVPPPRPWSFSRKRPQGDVTSGGVGGGSRASDSAWPSG